MNDLMTLAIAALAQAMGVEMSTKDVARMRGDADRKWDVDEARLYIRDFQLTRGARSGDEVSVVGRFVGIGCPGEAVVEFTAASGSKTRISVELSSITKRDGGRVA